MGTKRKAASLLGSRGFAEREREYVVLSDDVTEQDSRFADKKTGEVKKQYVFKVVTFRPDEDQKPVLTKEDLTCGYTLARSIAEVYGTAKLADQPNYGELWIRTDKFENPQELMQWVAESLPDKPLLTQKEVDDCIPF